jgi:hypothetical protein
MGKVTSADGTSIAYERSSGAVKQCWGCTPPRYTRRSDEVLP